MAVVALFRWSDAPEALAAAYRREMTDPPKIATDQPHRALHVFATGEGGAVVVDLWENEQEFRRMLDDPEFERNVQAWGWPSEPSVEVLQVRSTVLPEQAARDAVPT